MVRERRFWLYLLIIIVLFILWFFVVNYAGLSDNDRFILVMVYGMVFPLGICFLITQIFIINKDSIMTRINKRKGSKPFEYMFFIFLFLASYYLAWLVQSLDNFTDLFNVFSTSFLLSLCFSIALACGWLHYVEAMHN